MAMRCEQVVDVLVDYIDGELDAEHSQRLQNHCDSCLHCARFVETYCRTGKICRKALSVTMPGSVESTLFEFLRTELQSG